jgi:hypothetical protein
MAPPYEVHTLHVLPIQRTPNLHAMQSEFENLFLIPKLLMNSPDLLFHINILHHL